MKYAMQHNILDVAYEKPRLLLKNGLKKKAIVKLASLFKCDSISYSEHCGDKTETFENEKSTESSWLRSNAGKDYLAAHVSPRTWRRHSALISMIKEQQGRT